MARKVIDELSAAASGPLGVSVPLDPRGHMHVQIRFSKKGTPHRFMLDTGATTTLISQELLDEISQSLPENMWLSEFTELDERPFKLDGVTFSNFIVARFMESLESSAHWQQVDLDITQKGEMEELEVVKFTLFSSAQPSAAIAADTEDASAPVPGAQP